MSEQKNRFILSVFTDQSSVATQILDKNFPGTWGVRQINIHGTDPKQQPGRKRVFTELSWEVKGIGTFKRVDVMEWFHVGRDYLAEIMRVCTKSGKLPPGWGRALFLCVKDISFVELCQDNSAILYVNVRRLREDIYLNQADFSTLLGLSKNQVSALSGGGSPPRVLSLVLKQLEQAPKGTGNLLLDYAESRITSKEEEKILKRIREVLRWLPPD